ncbi:MAG: YhjD/YihY/BrkB family envelope integrity protein [Steroidobacteraceae bacterium]
MLPAVTNRLKQWLFDPGSDGVSKHLQPLLKLLRYPYALVRDMAQGELTLRAMSLVYSTLLSVAPFLALAFSVLKGLGYDQDLEVVLYQFLEPIGDKATELTNRIMGFVNGVRGGVLGPISLAFLIYTVISTIQKVEACFNFIWQVEKPRSWARRFSEYLSVMVIAPVFIVALVALLNSDPVTSLSHLSPVAWLLLHTRQLGTWLMVSAVMTLLYLFIPNTRVKLHAALVGGLSAGTLWTVGGYFFTRFVASSAQTTLIYAGFAIVILALIWIYMSWMILLLGAQISFYVQHPQSLRTGHHNISLSATLQERLGLSVMYLIARDYQQGTPHWTLNQLSARFNVPASPLKLVFQALESSGLLVTTDDECYLPGRDPATITLSEIFSVLRGDTHHATEHMVRPEIVAEAVAIAAAEAFNHSTQGRTLANLVATQAPSVNH